MSFPRINKTFVGNFCPVLKIGPTWARPQEALLQWNPREIWYSESMIPQYLGWDKHRNVMALPPMNTHACIFFSLFSGPMPKDEGGNILNWLCLDINKRICCFLPKKSKRVSKWCILKLENGSTTWGLGCKNIEPKIILVNDPFLNPWLVEAFLIHNTDCLFLFIQNTKSIWREISIWATEY